ncbi:MULTISPECIES: Txe/YoeB family addiction module toxin [Lacticaseibacillus]|uniref:Endoribonuclease YoeB n=2 Tax=Lacticaseibacillus TaxID=2759736 RepID=A0AAN1F0N3_LACCA|nr:MULTISPECIES: Txe/YoeB family addiction module toxin [Lacticaseibacillus]ARY92568.1 toxin YoeB [Lacticaseibacillus casei]KAB1969591.1 Txe/YoeB family addiction module toxin [Lacticaseibacillus casei]WLV80469.1 Txe/YoeB family addiction module toxin [Lacticaseibacillus sp. NCIMB 15473]WNX24430.1 Txe/YoeB family addiction module toxin [Lacticaseibacillus casei]WNX27202.1 Txe/YoeB family addiction module toxin [Lacticaseibacillus casei]
MIKRWTDDAWHDYISWFEQGDKATVRKINRLIASIDRTPFDGLGKPEPLKHALSGMWSRRITQEHRLIYEIETNTMTIISCRDHY